MHQNEVRSSRKIQRSHVLYDKKGDELVDDLEKNYYGSWTTDPLRCEHGQVMFEPTTQRDHLATPFRPLLPREQGGGNWLVLKFAFKRSTEPYGNCMILIQDDKFSLLETVRLVDGLVHDQTCTFVHHMEIKETLQGFRLVITSRFAERIPVPTSILVEQVSDDHPIVSERLRTRMSVAASLPVVELGLLDEEQLYRNVVKFSTEQIKDCYGRDPWIQLCSQCSGVRNRADCPRYLSIRCCFRNKRKLQRELHVLSHKTSANCIRRSSFRGK